MTLTLRPLTGLDPDQVSANLDVTVAAVQEDNPALDAARRGSVYDLLCYYHAVLGTQLLQLVADYLAGRSLAVLNATADPTLLADPTLADDVASNFGVTRLPGAAAAGTAAIVVNSPTTVTVAAGAVFQAAGLAFATAQAYTAKLDPSQLLNAGDVLLTPAGTNQWRFTVAVACTTAGAAGNLAADTALTPAAVPTGFVQAYAAGSFTGGVNAEATAQLLARLAQGVACKAPSNRVNYAALLRGNPLYAAFVAQSVVGAGDAEQLRDKHSVLPLALGGKVDWYVRTQEALLLTQLTKTATCLSVNAGAGTSVWQLSVGRDDAPGFYEFRNVRRLADDPPVSFALVSDSRALDLSGTAWVPDVASVKEGDYSRYLTAVLQFTDTLTPTSGLVPGATASYTLQAAGQPLVASIQDNLASSADARSRAADVLVKAPVPCFVAAAFTLYTPSTVAAPALAPIQNAVAHLVNTLGFAGVLYGSSVQAAVAPFLAAGQFTAGLSLSGRIRYPGTGSSVTVTGTDALAVPADAGNLVSPRTVQFYLDPNDVTITVVPVAPSS